MRDSIFMHQNISVQVKKTKPTVSPLQEARLIALLGDSRERVRRSKDAIRKSKSLSEASRNMIVAIRGIETDMEAKR